MSDMYSQEDISDMISILPESFLMHSLEKSLVG